MMGDKNKSSDFSLLTGVVIGSVVGSTLVGLYYSISKSRKRAKKRIIIPDAEYQDGSIVTDGSIIGSTGSTSVSDNGSTINFLRDPNVPNRVFPENQINTFHGVCGINTHQSQTYHHSRKGSEKIREIDTAPLELRKRFNNKGYV